MTASALVIRDATPGDIPSITAIYAHAVMHTVATLDTDEPTIASQSEWFRHHDERHPVIVGTVAGEVVGWASLSEWSPRTGYRNTAEASVYISPRHQSRGFGAALLEAIVDRARAVGLHLLVARIATTNEVSLRLTRRAGFTDVGTMREVGFKFENYVDVAVLQMLLDGTKA